MPACSSALPWPPPPTGDAPPHRGAGCFWRSRTSACCGAVVSPHPPGRSRPALPQPRQVWLGHDYNRAHSRHPPRMMMTTRAATTTTTLRTLSNSTTTSTA